MKLLIITAGIIFGPLIILGITKIISATSGTGKKSTPFKYVWGVFSKPKKLIMWAMIGALCYGGYLFACYLWPTPERLAFKELSKNLAEIELKPEKDRLAVFNEKVKNGERLTEMEKREAMEADKKIEKVRKDYSAGKLVPPPPKPASAKTKSVWVARLSADRKQIEEAMRMGVDQSANDKIEIGEEKALIKTDIEIRFSYKKRGKIHEVILTRENAELEHYYGIIDLSDNTQLELWLKEKGSESYEGNARQIIKRGEEMIYTPLIKASLRKEIIIS